MDYIRSNQQLLFRSSDTGDAPYNLLETEAREPGVVSLPDMGGTDNPPADSIDISPAPGRKEIRERQQKTESALISEERKVAAPSGPPSFIVMDDDSSSPDSLNSESVQGKDNLSLPARIDEQSDIVTLLEMKNRCENGSSGDEDRNRMFSSIARIAHGKGDPLTRRVARKLLNAGVGSTNPLEDCMLKEGPVTGPARYLGRIRLNLLKHGDRQHIASNNNITDILKALQQSTEVSDVSGETLKAVSCLAYCLLQRAESPLTEEIRVVEPPEMDRSLARDCIKLLDHWLRNGKITCLEDGQAVSPGVPGLEAKMMEGRLAVKDSSLMLDVPAVGEVSSGRMELADKILGELGEDFDFKRNPGFEKLDALYAGNRDEAREVIRAIVDLIHPHRDPRGDRLNQFKKLTDIYGIYKRPWLKELMQPLIGDILAVAPKADARGLLEENDSFAENLADVFKNIIKYYPEVTYQKNFVEFIQPLLSRAQNRFGFKINDMIEKSWEINNELVKPTLDLFAASDETPMDIGRWSLLIKGLERYGWLPDREQISALQARLYNPLDEGGKSILTSLSPASSEFLAAVRFFRVLRMKKTDVLKDVKLPDSEGRLVSPEKAVFDRVLTEAEGKGGSSVAETAQLLLNESSPQRDFNRDVCSFIAGDGETIERLLNTLEKEALTADSFVSLSGEAQVALPILNLISLKESEKGRFQGILHGMRHKPQRVIEAWSIVDKERNSHIDKGIRELAKESLSPSDSLDLARDLLTTATFLLDSSRAEKSSALIISSLLSNLNGTGNLEALKESLFRNVEGGLRESGILGKMPYPLIADLEILDFLSRDDSSLRERMRSIFRPVLSTDQGSGVVWRALRDFRVERMEENLKSLGEQPLSLGERLDLVMENFRFRELGNFVNDLPEKTLGAFKEGIARFHAGSSLGDLPLRLSDYRNIYEVYTLILTRNRGELEANCETYLYILKQVGGEKNFRASVDYFNYVEDMVAEGYERDRILEHVQQCLIIGCDPRDVPLKTAQDNSSEQEIFQLDSSLFINGLRLDLKDRGF